MIAGSTSEEAAVGGAFDERATRLTVLYDKRCGFCRRCRDWMLTQPCLVEVELLASGSQAAADRYGAVPWLGNELCVIDERGRVWAGPSAFLMCLWATARYRPLSYLLARPGWNRYAGRAFIAVSKRRDRLSDWLGRDDPECSWCDDVTRRRGI